MITYLVKDTFAHATYARPARVRAFTDYLSREAPGSSVISTELGGSSGSVAGSIRALGRLLNSLWSVASSRNHWVVVDYPNFPASVPRRLPVYVVASAYTGLLKAVCRLRGIGIVVQCDDDPVMQDEWLGTPPTAREIEIERRFERQLFGSADCLWFPGESAAELLSERYGVLDTPRCVVPNGATPAASERPDDGLVRFVYAGALKSDTHNVAGLIDAFAGTASSARLLLMGPDGDWIGAYLDEHPDPRVVHLGCLDASAAQAMLTTCDVGVLTGDADGYHSTGCPGKLGSYLAAGLPVVSTVRGECARILEQNGTGVVCTEAGLGDALSTLAADPARLDELRRRAEALKHRFAWDFIYGQAVSALPVHGHIDRPTEPLAMTAPEDAASGSGRSVAT